MSLRGRLLLVLAGVAVAGLLVADVATYAALRSSLLARVDTSLTGNARALAHQLARRGSADPSALQQLGASTPGVYIELRTPQGPPQTWTPPRLYGEEPAQPRLPGRVDLSGGESGILTVGSIGGGTRFRVRAEQVAPDATLLVAAPLDDVHATLRRLLLIEALVSIGVVAAVVGLGLLLVRVGLRPLRAIEGTAGAIAAGDLARRVEGATERTEVGRLGLALNAMLAQIEGAFAERTASEQRLRRFVGDASHELRTPLSAVRAYAELFERGARDRPEDLARAMAGIEREARRMGVLVDDLLLLARLDQGRPLARAPVDLVEVAHEAVDAARAVEPERPLELAAPASVVVEGDRDRLRQVVDNLLANVRAHTPPGAAATVRVVRGDGAALLEVADEGPGLAEADAEHVFERFYRGDPARAREVGADGGGSGLGLAIVAAIAEAHGGRASLVRARPGAAFRVTLPAGDGA